MRFLTKLLIFLCVLHLGTTLSHVVFPYNHLEVRAGSKMVIPCHLTIDRVTGDQRIDIEWRMAPDGSHRYMTILRHSGAELQPLSHQDQTAHQRSTYAAKKDCSLSISPLRLEDSGTYEFIVRVDGVQSGPVKKLYIHVADSPLMNVGKKFQARRMAMFSRPVTATIQTRDDEQIFPVDEKRTVTAHEDKEVPAYKDQEVTSHEDQEVTSHEDQEVTSHEDQEVTSYEDQEVTSYEDQEVTSYKDQEVPSHEGQEVPSHEGQEVTTDKEELLPEEKGPTFPEDKESLRSFQAITQNQPSMAFSEPAIPTKASRHEHTTADKELLEFFQAIPEKQPTGGFLKAAPATEAGQYENHRFKSHSRNYITVLREHPYVAITVGILILLIASALIVACFLCKRNCCQKLKEVCMEEGTLTLKWNEYPMEFPTFMGAPDREEELEMVVTGPPLFKDKEPFELKTAALECDEYPMKFPTFMGASESDEELEMVITGPPLFEDEEPCELETAALEVESAGLEEELLFQNEQQDEEKERLEREWIKNINTITFLEDEMSS